MNVKQGTQLRGARGQSLVETAIILPLLLLLVLNVVNLGYFFLLVTNLTGTSRTAALYSIEGSATPAQSPLPASGPGVATCGGTPNLNVAYVAQQDMCGAIWNPTSSDATAVTSITICSAANGIAASGTGTSNQVAICKTCSGSGTCTTATPTQTPDPEAPNFVSNQITIQYQFHTLIPGTIFNLPLRASSLCNSRGLCTFNRTAIMRGMN